MKTKYVVVILDRVCKLDMLFDNEVIKLYVRECSYPT